MNGHLRSCLRTSPNQIAPGRFAIDPELTRLSAQDSMSALPCSRHLSFRCPELNEGPLVRLVLRMSDGPGPWWAAVTCLEKLKLAAGRVLHIDHLFARMQRLNTYDAKTNAMMRVQTIASSGNGTVAFRHKAARR